MGKYSKKRKKKSVLPVVLITLLVLIVVVALVLFVMPQLLYRMNGESETIETVAQTQEVVQTAETTIETETQQEAISFPLLLEGGKLELQRLFQFSGINPDFSNGEGNNIASILLKNTSGIYLAEANMTLTIQDGTQLNFKITDVPAGKTVMAFSTENASVKADAACADVVCSAVFDADASLNEDKVKITVDGTQVILQNSTDAEIPELVVYCRSTLGEEYFGGVTYQYTVNNLPAYGSTTVDAVDCILGLAEVVCIAINEPE